MARFLRPAACLALSVFPAAAYYHFIHYAGSGQNGPIPEKLDLTALTSNTVVFFVSSAGPTQYSANDSFPSVLSQIRQAAKAWDSVPTSRLRVRFGGLYAGGVPQAAPGGEIVFEDEIPPGLLAFSTHTTATTPVQASDGSPFFPITRSIVHVKQDLTQKPGPSYSDSFFLTVVHEMGHAIGLQHTFTSSAMSTAVTRSTSLLRPLDLDDVAGVSLLYPASGFLTGTGSIGGWVTAGGHGVHMASVVALRVGSGQGAAAVSTLTNRDGSYRMDGLPPDRYVLYVHPLPPTADIALPLDADGNTIDAGGPFQTMFLNGASDPLRALVRVKAGELTDGMNFAVTPASSYGIYDVATWSFFGQSAVRPAYLNMQPGYGTLVAEGTNLGSDGRVSPDLKVRVVGGSATAYATLGYGDADQTYLAAYLQFSLAANPGPQHLFFSQGSDLYVLPSALHLTSKSPPVVNSVKAATDDDGNPVVAVSGSNFTPDNVVYFDGLPARKTKYLDESTLQAIPPPGAGGQNATVTVYSTDGQNSMFVAADPPAWRYPELDDATITISPDSLPAGSEAAVDIKGVNTGFADGLTTVGFGSNDIFVRRVWVLGPDHLLANVSVSPNASPTPTLASVISGFQIASRSAGFTALAPVTGLPVVVPEPVNAVWRPSGVFAGAKVSVFGNNLLAADARGATSVTINGKPVPVTSATATQVDIQLPGNLATGPAILKVNNGSTDSLPVAIHIGLAPPVISAVQTPGRVTIPSWQAVRAGETLTLLVSGLDPATVTAPTRVHISAGGVDHIAGVITAPPEGSNLYTVQFTLADSLPAGKQTPLTVSLDGRPSLPVYILVQ